MEISGWSRNGKIVEKSIVCLKVSEEGSIPEVISCPRLMPNFHPLQKMQIIWIINYYFSFVDFLDFVILKWRDRVLTHVRFRQTLIYHHCGFLNHARRATACVLTRRVQSMFLNSKWFCHKSIGNESGFESEQKFTKFELKIELGPHLVWLRNLLTNRRSRST